MKLSHPMNVLGDEGRPEGRNFWAPIVIGTGVGFLSGLFGVGGGIAIVPALVMLLHIEQRLAHGTSLAAVIPIAISGVFGYALSDSIEWEAFFYLVMGGIAGAYLGTHLLGRISHNALRIGFSIAMIVTALRLVIEPSTSIGVLNPPDPFVGILILGFLSGVLSGLLGVGGGIMMVPGMVLFFSFPAALAKGTSLAAVVPMAIAGTIVNLRKGNASVKLAIPIGLCGILGAFIGSRISVGMDPHLSSILFAILLGLVALRMLVSPAQKASSDNEGPQDILDVEGG
ncbi:MAG: uncharacterized protein QOG54_1390 [Actinomycetota bacterium]|jgi:uncharacterized membrane protein YfcA|nr:uncharacterized protein [Actinomycetota bacterium]